MRMRARDARALSASPNGGSHGSTYIAAAVSAVVELFFRALGAPKYFRLPYFLPPPESSYPRTFPGSVNNN